MGLFESVVSFETIINMAVLQNVQMIYTISVVIERQNKLEHHID